MDQKMWGKYGWATIYHVAATYDANHRPVHEFCKVLTQFRAILPCGKCRQNMERWMKTDLSIHLEWFGDDMTAVDLVTTLQTSVVDHVRRIEDRTPTTPGQTMDILNGLDTNEWYTQVVLFVLYSAWNSSEYKPNGTISALWLKLFSAFVDSAGTRWMTSIGTIVHGSTTFYEILTRFRGFLNPPAVIKLMEEATVSRRTMVI
jgi:hypothetical protein